MAHPWNILILQVYKQHLSPCDLVILQENTSHPWTSAELIVCFLFRINCFKVKLTVLDRASMTETFLAWFAHCWHASAYLTSASLININANTNCLIWTPPKTDACKEINNGRWLQLCPRCEVSGVCQLYSYIFYSPSPEIVNGADIRDSALQGFP